MKRTRCRVRMYLLNIYVYAYVCVCVCSMCDNFKMRIQKSIYWRPKARGESERDGCKKCKHLNITMKDIWYNNIRDRIYNFQIKSQHPKDKRGRVGASCHCLSIAMHVKWIRCWKLWAIGDGCSPPPTSVKCAWYAVKFVNIYALSFRLTTFNDSQDMQQRIEENGVECISRLSLLNETTMKWKIFNG